MLWGGRDVSRFILKPLNRHVPTSTGTIRLISIFRRRPLYKPTSAFGRTYIRVRNFTLGIATISVATFSIFYLLDARSAVHRYILTPVLRLVTPDPEDAHRIAVLALKYGLHPKDTKPDDPRLTVQVNTCPDKTEIDLKLWGKQLSNPVGVAAGLDKQAEAVDGLYDLGFSYVEIGSVTPEPQSGNDRPRYFRLSSDQAVINRLGFPSDGAIAVCRNLQDRVRNFCIKTSTHLAQTTPRSLSPNKMLAVNLGKNKDTPIADAEEDYLQGVRVFAPYADVLVINLSSPNTPGLRTLQTATYINKLLSSIRLQVSQLPSPQPRLVVKIAPDLNVSEIKDIAKAVIQNRIDGVIVSNTTTQRPGSLTAPHEMVYEQGGLSGPPLKPLSLRAIRILKSQLKQLPGGNDVVLIGCGGIRSGKDALEYARAGANIVQCYTGFVYDGVGFASRIKDEIVEQLGRRSWSDIVGTDS
jgi:dihydroorotate dehydrogenase